jgi:hypothetical protein
MSAKVKMGWTLGKIEKVFGELKNTWKNFNLKKIKKLKIKFY